MALDWDEALANAAAIVAQRNLPSVFLDDATADAMVDFNCFPIHHIRDGYSSRGRMCIYCPHPLLACARIIAITGVLQSLCREEELQKLTHVKLDRERLTCLPPQLFLLLPNLTNLYLQQNELTSLRALESATELRFLTVAGNRIGALEGSLCFLPHLLFLDVSDNVIEDINADVELPKSLSFLNLKNNPCCRTQKGLYQMLESCLTNLKELDWEDPPADETVNWEDDAELDEDTDGMSDNKQVYLKEEDKRKARFQEALNSSNLDVATFLATLQETRADQCFEDVDDPSGATEETGTAAEVVGNETVEDYKRFPGLELDDFFQDPGSTVKAILVNTCKKLQFECNEILQRSHLRVLEDEKALQEVKKECKARVCTPVTRASEKTEVVSEADAKNVQPHPTGQKENET